MHDDDVLRGKLDAIVGARNGWVIPFSDFAEKDSSQSFGSEVQFLGDSWDVVGGNHRTQDSGKMKNSGTVLVLIGLELIIIHWSVRSTKIYCSVRYLLNARTGAH